MKRNLSGWGVTIAGLLLAGGGVYAMWTGWDIIQVERGWSLFIAGAVALSGGVVTAALGRVIAHLARSAAQGESAMTHSVSVSGEEAAPAPAPVPAPAPALETPELAKPEPAQAKPVVAEPPAAFSQAKAAIAEITPVATRTEPTLGLAKAAITQSRFTPRPIKPAFTRADAGAAATRRDADVVDLSSPITPPAESVATPAEAPTEVDRYAAGDATYIMMSDGSVEVRSAAGTQRYPSLAALKAEATARQR